MKNKTIALRLCVSAVILFLAPAAWAQKVSALPNTNSLSSNSLFSVSSGSTVTKSIAYGQLAAQLTDLNPLNFGAATNLANNAPAFQAMFNVAAKNLVIGQNVSVSIPAGIFNFTAPILLTNCRSLVVRGAGRNNTILQANYAGPVLRTDGCWFSVFDSIQFKGTVGHTGAVFELDGNRAHDAVNFGVQGNTFRDCYFDGSGLVANGLSVCPVGSSFGQGSENLYLGCHFNSCTNAGYFQTGANALQNTFIGGNVQACNKYGLLAEFGSFNVNSMGFQNGFATQTGYDIALQNSGTEVVYIDGCRSESLRGVTSAPKAIVKSWSTASTPPVWSPTTVYSLSNIVQPTITSGYAFRCTVAGTSSNTEPAWLDGAVTESSGVKWQAVADALMNVNTLLNSRIYYGKVSAFVLMGNTFTRSGFLFDANVYLGGSFGGLPGGGTIAFGNDVIIPGATTFTNFTFATGSMNNSAKVFGRDILELGDRPLIWTFGTGGAQYRDVGLFRNDGQVFYGYEQPPDWTFIGDYSHNVLGVIGSLGKPRQFNAVGDKFRLVGGIGTNTLGGGGIEFWTQPAGSNDAALRMSLDSDGTINVTGSASIRTNIANLDVTTNAFVLGTRYTNSNRRSFIAASFLLTASGSGPASVRLTVENPGIITNNLIIQTSNFTVAIESLFLPVGPNCPYTFTDTSAGGTVTNVAGTSSKMDW